MREYLGPEAENLINKKVELIKKDGKMPFLCIKSDKTDGMHNVESAYYFRNSKTKMKHKKCDRII